MASRYISRRERTTQLVVGGSACAAVVAWFFWADIQKRFIQPRFTLLKPTIKTRMTGAAAKAYNAFASSPAGIHASVVSAIRDSIASGVPLEEIRETIRLTDGYNAAQFNQALALAVKPV